MLAQLIPDRPKRFISHESIAVRSHDYDTVCLFFRLKNGLDLRDGAFSIIEVRQAGEEAEPAWALLTDIPNFLIKSAR